VSVRIFVKVKGCHSVEGNYEKMESFVVENPELEKTLTKGTHEFGNSWVVGGEVETSK